MSFFGQKFKKSDFEGIVEVLDSLNISDKIRGMLRSPDSLSCFTKNADGTITYTVESNGTVMLNETFVLDQESEFTTPDGDKAKTKFSLNGNELKSTLAFADGKVINLDRVFEGNTMKLTVSAAGSSQKGVVVYTAV